VSDTYVCAMCGETFISGWSEEEARAEYAQNFPGSTEDDRGSACDDCYEMILTWARERGLLP
jgi:DNA-directed RNA polymerase subunit RPC12/RpoP